MGRVDILAVQLTELLQVIHAQVVAGQVEHDILQCTGVAIGEDKAITVGLEQGEESTTSKTSKTSNTSV